MQFLLSLTQIENRCGGGATVSCLSRFVKLYIIAYLNDLEATQIAILAQTKTYSTSVSRATLSFRPLPCSYRASSDSETYEMLMHYAAYALWNGTGGLMAPKRSAQYFQDCRLAKRTVALSSYRYRYYIERLGTIKCLQFHTSLPSQDNPADLRCGNRAENLLRLTSKSSTKIPQKEKAPVSLSMSTQQTAQADIDSVQC